MSDFNSLTSDIFAIQTLYDGKWRFDGKFDTEGEAQKYASILIPDWGRARVRLLSGRYDADQSKYRYYKIDFVAPISRLQSAFKSIKSRLPAKPLSGTVSALFGGALLLTVLVGGVAAISFPSNAANMQVEGNQRAEPQNRAPIARNITQIFADLTKKSFGKTTTLKAVPVRLLGHWSQACVSGHQDLVVSKNKITEFDGAIAQDIELQAVFQAGQTYGFVRENGSVSVVELISFDQMNVIGKLDPEGAFSAASDSKPLSRCL